jgi:hypothetical protein
MQTGSRFRVRRAAGAVQTDCYEARTDARQAAPFRCFGRHFYGPSVLRHRNAAALSIDPDRRCHILVTECGCAWDRGKPLPFGAARGGNHGQRRQRFSAVLLYGIIRHGDCPRGREPAHLMQPLCLATLLGQ